MQQEGFLRFDNFDGHVLLRFGIDGPDDLPERSLPDPFLHDVPAVKHFSGRDEVIVMVVVPAVVVRTAGSGSRLLGCSGGATGIALLVIHLVDLFVGVNEGN